MKMSSKMDAGDIISQQAIPILDTDNGGTLHDKLSILGRDLLIKTLPSIIDNTAYCEKQNESEATFAWTIKKEDEHIDYSNTTREIINQIRGLSPYPAAFTTLLPLENAGDTPAESVSMKIYFGEPVYKDTEGRKPGTIVSDGRTFMEIITSDGAISIKDLQIAGKKRMDVKAFLLGFRDPQSYSAN